MTWTIYINFLPPFQRRLHIKMALIGEAVSEEKTFENVNGRTPDNGYPIRAKKK